jgi:dTDP-glucose pyrophosphorylase
MKDWKNLLVRETNSIYDAIKVIDASLSQIALVVSAEQHLIGTVTDGDIRRALLKGIDLQSNVATIMGEKCHKATSSSPREEVYAQMLQLGIRHLPIVGPDNTVVGLNAIDDFMTKPKMNIPVVIMAGGLGTRLRPLTDDTPKPMLKIGAKPILETIIDRLIAAGFSEFYIAVNYRSDVIKNYFKDGKKWNVSIKYLEEQESKGTAGALSLLGDNLTDHYLVVNGDVLTQVNFQALVEFHLALKSAITMCVRDYEIQVPYGVVEVDSHKVTSLKEKPKIKYFVNGGMYIVSADAIRQIPSSGKYDMTQLIDNLLLQDHVVSSFPVHEYWLDVGKHDDFQKAALEYEKIFVPPSQKLPNGKNIETPAITVTPKGEGVPLRTK